MNFIRIIDELWALSKFVECKEKQLFCKIYLNKISLSTLNAFWIHCFLLKLCGIKKYSKYFLFEKDLQIKEYRTMGKCNLKMLE